jgi:hypothetical protein
VVDWRQSSDKFGGVILEADYEDTVVTETTRANLFITKCPGNAHQNMLKDFWYQVGVIE